MRPVNSSLPGLRAGTYRPLLRDTVTAFEREVTLKGGEIAQLAITLTPAAPVKVAPGRRPRRRWRRQRRPPDRWPAAARIVVQGGRSVSNTKSAAK